MPSAWAAAALPGAHAKVRCSHHHLRMEYGYNGLFNQQSLCLHVLKRAVEQRSSESDMFQGPCTGHVEKAAGHDSRTCYKNRGRWVFFRLASCPCCVLECGGKNTPAFKMSMLSGRFLAKKAATAAFTDLQSQQGTHVSMV